MESSQEAVHTSSMKTSGRATIDSGYAWVVLTSAFVCHMITASSWSTFGLYYIEFLSNFSEHKALLAWMWAILGATWGIVGALVGKLITSFGARRIAILGGVCGAAGYLSTSFCYNFTAICLLYGLLVGFGNCCIVSSAYVAVQHSFDKKRSFANGLSAVGGNFGLFSCPPLIEFLIAEFGWRGSFIIQGGIYLNVLVAASLFIPHKRPISEVLRKTSDVEEGEEVVENETSPNTNYKHQNKQYSEMHDKAEDVSINTKLTHRQYVPNNSDVSDSHEVVNAERTNEKKKKEISTNNDKHGIEEKATNDSGIKTKHKQQNSFFFIIKNVFREMFSCDKSMLTNCKFILYTIGYFGYQYGHHTPMIFIVPRASAYGISNEMAALLMSSWAVGGTVGFVLIGWIGDKCNCVAVCGVSCIGAGLLTAGTCWFRSFPWLCFYSVTFGFFSGGFYGTNVPALVDVVGPEKVAIANGLVLTPSGIAGLIAAPIASWLTLETGTYYAAFICAGASMFIGGALLIAIPGSRLCWWRRRKANISGSRSANQIEISYSSVPLDTKDQTVS